jgi:hypothetical protein
VQSGGEDLRQSAGTHPIDSPRNGHQVTLVDCRELCLPSATDDRHHTRADLKAPTAITELQYFAGQLHSRNVLRGADRRRIQPASLHHVPTVEPRGPHPHQHLAGPRRGIGMLFDQDLLLADGDGAHEPEA